MHVKFHTHGASVILCGMMVWSSGKTQCCSVDEEFSWMKNEHSTRYLYIAKVVQLCHMMHCIVHKCIRLSVMLSH